MREDKYYPFKDPRAIETQEDPDGPTCVFTDAVACDPKHRNCEKCGWNPEVAAARTEKIFPGYLTALQHLTPVECERVLVGKWNIPAAE